MPTPACATSPTRRPSPANLYHYFSGKDEILFYCQDRALDRMLAAVGRARRLPTADARVQTVLTTHVLTLLDDVEGATAHLRWRHLRPSIGIESCASGDRYERALRRLVADGMADGSFASADAGLVTRAMLGSLNWSVTWYRRDGAWPPARVAEAMVAYLLAGLRP
ncbi:MAG: hypothetical protein R2712_17335 [Vicinamibacterales bacterium]